MRFRQFLKQYFSFNKRERNAVLLLSILIFVLIISNLYFKSIALPITINITPILKKTETTPSLKKNYANETKKYTNKNKHGKTLFVFDPNQITEDQAITLGWNNKLAKVLTNYKNKGGKFKKKEDLKKLFGMTPKFYSEIEPYILIQNSIIFLKDSSKNSIAKSDQKKITKKIIEINSADSIELISLNGIGAKLCSRIIKFRKSVGGFYSKEQLKEVYGMQDTLYNLFSESISVNASLINKIKINTANSEELKKHLYIKFMIAQSIVNYRMQHGKYTSAADLLNVGNISQETISKLKPYLEF